MDTADPDRSAAVADPSTSRRLTAVVALVAAVVLVVDQVTKAVAVAELVEGERHDVLGSLLGIQLLYNPGAAFSMGTGYTWVFTVVMIAVIVVVARSSRRLGSRGWAGAFGLLLGGAAGNLVDRVVREPAVFRGEVVDFIAYADWFIGNVADIAIVGAAGFIVVLALRGIGLDGSRERDQRSSSATGDAGGTRTRTGSGSETDDDTAAGTRADGAAATDDAPDGSPDLRTPGDATGRSGA